MKRKAKIGQTMKCYPFKGSEIKDEVPKTVAECLYVIGSDGKVKYERIRSEQKRLLRLLEANNGK